MVDRVKLVSITFVKFNAVPLLNQETCIVSIDSNSNIWTFVLGIYIYIYMGLVCLLQEAKNYFILSNSCNSLTRVGDLFLEPNHKRQLIHSQNARISFFMNTYKVTVMQIRKQNKGLTSLINAKSFRIILWGHVIGFSDVGF